MTPATEHTRRSTTQAGEDLAFQLNRGGIFWSRWSKGRRKECFFEAPLGERGPFRACLSNLSSHRMGLAERSSCADLLWERAHVAWLRLHALCLNGLCTPNKESFGMWPHLCLRPRSASASPHLPVDLSVNIIHASLHAWMCKSAYLPICIFIASRGWDVWRCLRGPDASLPPPLLGSEKTLLCLWILHSEGREQRNPAFSQCLLSTQHVRAWGREGRV